MLSASPPSRHVSHCLLSFSSPLPLLCPLAFCLPYCCCGFPYCAVFFPPPLQKFFFFFFGIQYIYISDVRNKKKIYIFSDFFFSLPRVKKFRLPFILTSFPSSSLIPPYCPLPHFLDPLFSPTTVPHPLLHLGAPVVFAFFVDS